MQRIKQLLKAVLNELNPEFYLTDANNKIPDNCKYPLALNQAPQNQKQAKKRRFISLPGSKKMLQ